MGQSTSSLTGRRSESGEGFKLDGSGSDITDLIYKLKSKKSDKIVPISEYIKKEKRNRNQKKIQEAKATKILGKVSKKKDIRVDYIDSSNEVIPERLEPKHRHHPRSTTKNTEDDPKKHEKKTHRHRPTSIGRKTTHKNHRSISRPRHSNAIPIKKEESSHSSLRQEIKQIYKAESFTSHLQKPKRDKHRKKGAGKKIIKPEKIVKVQYETASYSSDTDKEKKERRRRDKNYKTHVEQSSHRFNKHHYSVSHHKIPKESSKNLVVETNVACSIDPNARQSFDYYQRSAGDIYTKPIIERRRLSPRNSNPSPNKHSDHHRTFHHPNPQMRRKYSEVVNELESRVGLPKEQQTPIKSRPENKENDMHQLTKTKVNTTKLEYMAKQHKKNSTPKEVLETWKKQHKTKQRKHSTKTDSDEKGSNSKEIPLLVRRNVNLTKARSFINKIRQAEQERPETPINRSPQDYINEHLEDHQKSGQENYEYDGSPTGPGPYAEDVHRNLVPTVKSFVQLMSRKINDRNIKLNNLPTISEHSDNFSQYGAEIEARFKYGRKLASHSYQNTRARNKITWVQDRNRKWHRIVIGETNKSNKS